MAIDDHSLADSNLLLPLVYLLVIQVIGGYYYHDGSLYLSLVLYGVLRIMTLE